MLAMDAHRACKPEKVRAPNVHLTLTDTQPFNFQVRAARLGARSSPVRRPLFFFS
jgi:hypothetical protein